MASCKTPFKSTLKPRLTALIDGDILVYQAALQAEHEHRWEDDALGGLWTYHAYEADGQALFRHKLQELVAAVKADDFVIALTDPDRNWRLDILPTYKGNRKATRRPLLRRHLNEWVKREYAGKAYLRPNLEGDDVLGILATHPTLVPGERIVVSIDKDFKTIPGRHYHQGKQQFFDITPEQADWWHMYQTITGDATDGYAGCPGAGPKEATELCDAPYLCLPYQHVMKSGPRKGQLETRYRKEPTGDLWAAVVSLYASKGLGENIALQQARVARICRHTDYDFQQRKVKPWTPNPSRNH